MFLGGNKKTLLLFGDTPGDGSFFEKVQCPTYNTCPFSLKSKGVPAVYDDRYANKEAYK